MDPAWDEGALETGKPRATRKKKSRMGRLPSTITLEELSSWFHLPAEEAAKMMRVSLTVLKRVARKQGINRWPYRKVKSLTRAITSSQPASSGPRNSSGLLEPLLGGSPRPTLEQQVAAAAVAAAAVANQGTQRPQQPHMQQQQQLPLPGLLGQPPAALPPLPLPTQQQWPELPAPQQPPAEPAPSWGAGSNWQAHGAAGGLGGRLWNAQQHQQHPHPPPLSYAQPALPVHRPQPQQIQPASAEPALPQAWRLIQQLLQQQQQQQQQQQAEWPAQALGGMLQEGSLPDLAAIRAAAAAVTAALAPQPAATPADSTALTPTSADTRGIEVLLTAIEKEQQVEEPAGGRGAGAAGAAGAALSEEVAAPSPHSTQLGAPLPPEERGDSAGGGEPAPRAGEEPPLMSIGSEGGSAGSSTDPTIASSQPSASGATPASSTLAALLGGAAGSGLHRLAAGSTAQLSALLRGERGGGSAFQPLAPPFDRAASPPAGAAPQVDRGQPGAGLWQAAGAAAAAAAAAAPSARQQLLQLAVSPFSAGPADPTPAAPSPAASQHSKSPLVVEPSLQNLLDKQAVSAVLAAAAAGRQQQQQQQAAELQPPAAAPKGQEAAALQRKDSTESMDRLPTLEFPQAAAAAAAAAAASGDRASPPAFAADFSFGQPGRAAPAAGRPRDSSTSRGASPTPLQVATAVGAKRPAPAAAPGALPAKRAASEPPATAAAAAGAPPSIGAASAQQLDLPAVMGLLRHAAGLQALQSAQQQQQQQQAADARMLLQMLMSAGGAPPAPAPAPAPPAANPATSWQQVLGLARAAGAFDAPALQHGAGAGQPASPHHASAQLAALQLQLEAEKRAREEAMHLAQQRAQLAAAAAAAPQQAQQAGPGANPAVPEQIALLCLQKYAQKLGYNIDSLHLQQ